jgi:hypothetical protein
MSFEHKELAASLFNGVWELLDKKDRTQEEDYQMVHMAHASLYHWLQIGTPNNFYVGEWQISRVYAVLKNHVSSLFHAQHALKICEDNGFKGFDLAYACEAMARALALGGDSEGSEKYLRMAQAEAAGIPGKEERDMLLADLESVSLT